MPVARKAFFATTLISVLFFIVGCITINAYGITWDEPENFMMGRIYLNLYMHPFSHVLDNPTRLTLPPAIPFRLETHFERYPPFADTLASLSSLIFAEKLKLLNVISAHHLVALLFGSVGILATGLIAWELTHSLLATAISALILATYPLYVGHAHMNIKDIPGAAMFTLSIYAFVRAIKKKSIGITILTGIVFGLSLATKITTIIALLVIAITQYKQKIDWKHIAFFFVATIVTLAIAWPWLFLHPIGHLILIYTYTQEVGRGLPVQFGGTLYHAGVDTPWYYALWSLIIITPLPILGLAIVGYRKPLPYVWLGMVLVRYLLPRVIVYNGVRQFMEVIPALAILAGIGITNLRIKKPAYIGLVSALVILPSLVANIRLHPYEMLYFNMFTGTMKHAAQAYEFDYWGFSAPELIAYLNSLPAAKGKTANINWLEFPTWYYPNNDITLVTSDKKPDFVIVPHSENYFAGATTYLDTHAKRIYTVRREDADVGYLYDTR